MTRLIACRPTILLRELAENLGGTFGKDADGHTFKDTLVSSFESVSLGTVDQSRLSGALSPMT